MWEIVFTEKAEKQFSKLDRQTQQDIVVYLERIRTSDTPVMFGKALVGDLSGFWRYRVGKYRLICEIQKHVFLVEIITIGKRDKIYG